MSKSKKVNGTKVPSVAIVPDVLKGAVMARINDEGGKTAFPILYDCLVPQYHEGALVRPAAKINITVEGSYWRVQLDLPFERLTCRIFCADLSRALLDLNAYLQSGMAVFSPLFERNKKPLPRLDATIQ